MNIETILGSILFLFLIFGWIIIFRLGTQILLLERIARIVQGISDRQLTQENFFNSTQIVIDEIKDIHGSLRYDLGTINSSLSELKQMNEYLFEIETYLTIWDKPRQESIETMLDKINSNVSSIDCNIGMR
jgi:hypothetical protein